MKCPRLCATEITFERHYKHLTNKYTIQTGDPLYPDFNINCSELSRSELATEHIKELKFASTDCKNIK